MTAQMTEGWWKTAWPSKTLPKSFTPMKMAIKEVKAAKRGLSIDAHKQALAELLKLVPTLRKEADAAFTKRTPNHFKAKSMLDDLEKLAQKEEKAIKPNLAPEKVFSMAFGTALKKKVSNKELLANLGPLQVELNLMIALVNELKARKAAAKLNDALMKAFNASVDRTAAHIEKAIKIHKGIVPGTVRDDIGKMIDDEVQNVLPAELRKVPATVLRKIGLAEKAAKQYTIDKGCSVCKGVVGTSIAGVGLVVPGTPALAIAVMCRTGSELAKDVISSFASVEKKTKLLNAYMKTLTKAFSDGEAKGRKMTDAETSGELTLSTLNSLLGIDVLPTVTKAKSDIKSIEGGIALLHVEHQKMIETSHKLFEKYDALKKEIESDIRTKGSTVEKTVTKLKNVRPKMQKQLEQTAKMGERISDAESEIDKIRKDFSELSKPGTKLTRAQHIVKISTSALTAVAGTVDATAIAAEISSTYVAMAGTLTEAANQMDNMR